MKKLLLTISSAIILISMAQLTVAYTSGTPHDKMHKCSKFQPGSPEYNACKNRLKTQKMLKKARRACQNQEGAARRDCIQKEMRKMRDKRPGSQ